MHILENTNPLLFSTKRAFAFDKGHEVTKMSSEGIREIEQAIDKVRYSETELWFLNRYRKWFQDSGKPASGSKVELLELVPIRGRVPIAFFNWFAKLEPGNNWEQELLDKCWFKEV